MHQLFSMPGNEIWRDRVVRIRGVKRDDEVEDNFAVLVGVAQYIQHHTGIRSRPNVALAYDPKEGFNSSAGGALKGMVSTRSNTGISSGQQALLNYGTAYDFEAAAVPAGDAHVFQGALNAMLEEQKKKAARQPRSRHAFPQPRRRGGYKERRGSCNR